MNKLLARTYELLQDGEWHDYEDILAEATKIITPGEAIRWAEKNRMYQAKKMRGVVKPRVKQNLDDNDLIRGAKRDEFRQRCWASAHIVYKEENGVKYMAYRARMGHSDHPDAQRPLKQRKRRERQR